MLGAQEKCRGMQMAKFSLAIDALKGGESAADLVGEGEKAG